MLGLGTTLYRVHRLGRSPWWFSSDGSGRFDLAPPKGTCYLAEEPLGALLEVTRGLTILSEQFLAGRRLFSTTLTTELRVADLTVASAYGFGVTAELSAAADYTDARAWSKALEASGFGGVRYHVRHDPRSDLTGVAWFGRAGRGRGPAGSGQALPAEVLLSAAPFGIRVAGDLPAIP